MFKKAVIYEQFDESETNKFLFRYSLEGKFGELAMYNLFSPTCARSSKFKRLRCNFFRKEKVY